MDKELLVGKTIRILNLHDEPEERMTRYRGLVGVVASVETDPWGDTRIMGTWGSIAIYPDKDDIEYVD